MATPTTQDRELERKVESIYNTLLEVWNDLLYTTFDLRKAGLADKKSAFDSNWNKIYHIVDRMFNKIEKLRK